MCDVHAHAHAAEGSMGDVGWRDKISSQVNDVYDSISAEGLLISTGTTTACVTHTSTRTRAPTAPLTYPPIHSNTHIHISRLIFMQTYGTMLN